MTGRLRSEDIVLRGTYGDMEIRVVKCVPESPIGVHVVLLHGVHSSANMGLQNKFRRLAETLVSRGFTPWLVETSRRLRNRADFADDLGAWIRGAFDGKTFAQEQEDFFIAIDEIAKRAAHESVWLWGFSLGGMIALSAAARAVRPLSGSSAAIDRLIMSGTGLVAYSDTQKRMMKMPIISTIGSSLSPDILGRVRVSGCILFRGSEDELFSERSCIDLLDAIDLPPEKKHFHAIEGADHSMRLRYGRNAPDIMDEMVDFIVGKWL
jgi:dienelactone hydrolase